jgi:hypothetical protein
MVGAKNQNLGRYRIGRLPSFAPKIRLYGSMNHPVETRPVLDSHYHDKSGFTYSCRATVQCPAHLQAPRRKPAYLDPTVVVRFELFRVLCPWHLGDRRKHAMYTLCRAATRSCASFHRKMCQRAHQGLNRQPHIRSNQNPENAVVQSTPVSGSWSPLSLCPNVVCPHAWYALAVR